MVNMTYLTTDLVHFGRNCVPEVIFPADIVIVRRKYLNLTGNTDKTRHQKDQLSQYNCFLTHIIIIYCLKSEYLNTTTVLLILSVLNTTGSLKG